MAEPSDAFSPAGGGMNQACRGANTSDNSNSYFVAYFRSMSLDACKALCIKNPGCKGVEHSSSKCEVWTRSIGATVRSDSFQCLRYEPFSPVDGGADRSCRGRDATDNLADHFVGPVDVASLDACKALCVGTQGCKGVEYGGGRCEVWIRDAGIGASTAASGRTCLRYEPFTLADGGIDRACRGADTSDNSASYYTVRQLASLEDCRAACVGTRGCKGLEYRGGRCEVWTRAGGIGATAPAGGDLCLRFGASDPGETGDAFEPVDGGLDRACRGASSSDNSESLYMAYHEAASLDACKARCVATPGCRGVEHSAGKCEVWMGDIGASVQSTGYQCLRYQPFVPLHGGSGRACRGANRTDNSPAYYTSYTTAEAPSLDTCKALCIGTRGCTGVEYSSQTCEVWTRREGIDTSTTASGHTCLRYEPFHAADGGRDRACEGSSPTDSWPSYYTLHSLAEATSLDACKDLCIGTPGCRGVEYSGKGCKVWTRPRGIGFTSSADGSTCLRYGFSDPVETADAFRLADGGVNRACRGANPADNLASYYMAVGPAMAPSLEACKALCIDMPGCRGVDYGSDDCRLWKRPGGVGATVEATGRQCLRYDPFVPVDGGSDRVCRGATGADNLASYYALGSGQEVQSLEACKDFCVTMPGCKGVEYSSGRCEAWTRPKGIGATAAGAGFQCLRYEPFALAGSGKDRACRGGSAADDSAAYYDLHGSEDGISLDACRTLCVGTPRCRGVEYGAEGCKVWIRPDGIATTVEAVGSFCLRYGPSDPLEEAEAFMPADGAIGRACRGATAGDNSASYYMEYSRAVAPTLDACKARCIDTPGCTGVEFSSEKCEVWTRPGGIGATVQSTDAQCYRYEPFSLVNGFRDQACRGEDPADNSPDHYVLRQAESLEACQALCVSEPGCRGVEYSGSGRCEVWTRPGGILAVVKVEGYQCLRYEPFSHADAGKDRACRGVGPDDHWPSYYRLYGSDASPSLAACKALCAGASDCRGLQYSSGRCEVWTRPRGIGSTVPDVGSLCLRYGHYDPMDTADAFAPVDRGTDRACRGADSQDDSANYYTLVGTAKATSLEVCKALCIGMPGCNGVEYGGMGCKLWTRPDGIGATAESSGSTCLRYDAFVPVDGGADRACRGASPDDDSATYHISVPVADAPSLQACQARCVATPGCKGVEHSPQSCEIWTRAEGISATMPSSGSSCLRYEPFTAVDGGRDRACRGANSADNSTHHVTFHLNSQGASLDACRALCIGTPSCQGVEFNSQGCSVWTRPAGISTTVEARGSVCLRYGPGAAGMEQAGPRLGQIRLAVTPSRCLEVVGGSVQNGANLRIADCLASSSSQRFSVAGDGTGHIRLLEHPTKCVDVSGGQDFDGNSVQLWDCQDPPHQNMQFLLPGGGVGQVRWAAHPDKCLDLSGESMQIWACGDPARHAQFILPPGSFWQLRVTKYVTHYLPWFLGASVDPACAARPATCAYRDDHWCSSYGNSFYASTKGAYDITQQSVIDQQLDEMRDAGLDGLWIDYQSANWDGVVDSLITGARARGMGFAILIDDTINPNIMEASRTEIAEWVRQPHYFRHQGFPVVPVFNSESTVFAPLPFAAVYISRAEIAKPSWAVDTYTWVHGDDGFLSMYYRQEHPAFASGSAFRGYRDCYIGKSLGFPHVGMLGPSLALAGERQPEFVQLNTWNDYTEGTMLEPSWLREEATCVDVCGATYDGKACLTTAVCGSHDAFTDCSKPVGKALGPGPAACGATGNLSARTELDQVKRHILAQRVAEAALVQ